MKFRRQVLLVGSMLGIILFLLFPSPVNYMTLYCGNPKCDYELQDWRTEWEKLGGLDLVCTIMKDGTDAIGGKAGSRAIKVRYCLFPERTSAESGDTEYDRGSIPIPYVLGAALMSEVAGLSLAYLYGKIGRRMLLRRRN